MLKPGLNSAINLLEFVSLYGYELKNDFAISDEAQNGLFAASYRIIDELVGRIPVAAKNAEISPETVAGMDYHELIALKRRLAGSRKNVTRIRREIAKFAPDANPLSIVNYRDQMTVISRELMCNGKCPCCAICFDSARAMLETAAPDQIKKQLHAKMAENFK
ncbi:MAG: hypothetical protein PHI85_09275 [Victivallaceae bacterium]|nr:hypothetical protein [Victivallaceae bacterium]